MDAFANGEPLPVKSQIGDEIEYFREYYEKLLPKVFLSYDREAYFDIGGSDFRITFDDNILYRTEELSLCSHPNGKRILAEGLALMEVKTSGAIPIWLAETLTEKRIFKTSFSKYGTAYSDMITNIKKEDFTYAGISFEGADAIIISNSGMNSAIDTERGYSYTAGSIVAIMPTGGMSSEAKHCENFTSVGTSKNMNLSSGSTLTVSGDMNKTVTMPCSINAFVIILNKNTSVSN